MRIIAGNWRGRRLASVGKGDMGAHLRPTPDRVRESLFSMLQSGRFGDVVDGARVLDLFAGTGALGLEALSRGAEHATFIENGRVALGLLTQNIDLLGANAKVIRSDARRCSIRYSVLICAAAVRGRSAAFIGPVALPAVHPIISAACTSDPTAPAHSAE